MVDPTAVLLTRDADECGPRISEQPVPHWPNLAPHREAWERAKAELGPDASVSQIARHAQDILNRAKLAEQAQDEVLQESAK